MALAGALLVAAALVALLPTAAAAQSALEEYVLTLPGAEEVEVGAPDLDPARNAGPGGVSGEREASAAPIAALGSTISQGWVAVVAVSSGLLAFALARRRGEGH